MRSRSICNISRAQAHAWVSEVLAEGKLFKDHGWLCTKMVLINIVLHAAARCMSVSAACRDVPQGPSDQAVMTALDAGLPRMLTTLEGRINAALASRFPKRLRRRKWEVAIDWHLSPYYGQPMQSKNELYYGKPRQGTKQFHAYATACITSRGERYTLALTWVRRHEATVTALRRLLTKIRESGLKIRCLLLDRAFFNVPVTAFLQGENLPFLMPVMFRGRRSKKRRKATGLRWIKQQKAGWYKHTMKNGKRQVTVKICVGYRRHRNRKDGKQRKQKLLFAAWRVHGSPVEIRERYRKRFGIEASYRQMRQARIYTCTPNPRLRLLFVAVALILRNVWVWIHHMHLASGPWHAPQFQLERLRFKQMLHWLVHEIMILFSSGSLTCATGGP